MSTTTKLTVKSAVVICRTYAALRKDARYFAAKDDAAVRLVIRATAASLRKVSVAGVEPDVRLPAAKLTQMLWTLFKAAKVVQAARAEALALADDRNSPAGPCFYCGGYPCGC